MADNKNPMVKKLQMVGNRFMFNFFLEQFRPTIIKEFKKWLKPLTPAMVKEMIRDNKFPELDPEWFQTMGDYRKYILEIKYSQVMDALSEAAEPKIMMAIMECGEEGHLWLNALYVYLLECVDHPEKLIPEPPKVEVPEEKMVTAKCQTCNKTWPVKMADFSSIQKCPFCGTSTKEPPPATAPPPATVPPTPETETPEKDTGQAAV